MKANQHAILKDDEAVSPVIAVILMVAITVVLAATVFVLVNELGQNVGSTGPQLGLTTAGGPTSAALWEIRVSSATQSNPISEYTFVLSAPGGTVSAEWADPLSLDTAAECYQLTISTGGTDLAVGERLQLRVNSANDCTGTWDADFPSGQHELEAIHRPSGSTAGSISRPF